MLFLGSPDGSFPDAFQLSPDPGPDEHLSTKPAFPGYGNSDRREILTSLGLIYLHFLPFRQFGFQHLSSCLTFNLEKKSFQQRKRLPVVHSSDNFPTPTPTPTHASRKLPLDCASQSNPPWSTDWRISSAEWKWPIFL